MGYLVSVRQGVRENTKFWWYCYIAVDHVFVEICSFMGVEFVKMYSSNNKYAECISENLCLDL